MSSKNPVPAKTHNESGHGRLLSEPYSMEAEELSRLEYHPYSERMPKLSEDEQASRASSMSDFGQVAPIILYQGKILDGRHRWKIFVDAKAGAIVRKFEGNNAEALQFAYSANLQNRHLTSAQRTLLAVEYVESMDNEGGI